jgi:hypothetical protein
MMSAITILVRMFSFAVGGLFLYIALLLYPTEEGRIQNWLEELWIKTHDARRQALSWHTTFMRTVASLMESLSNKLFGIPIFSLQSVGVSLCYSMASLSLVVLLSQYLRDKGGTISYDFLWLLTISIVYGMLPTLLEERKWIKLWFAGLILLAFTKIIGPLIQISQLVSKTDYANLALFPLLIILSMAIAVAVFTMSIAVIRTSIRKIAASRSSLRTLVISLANCIPPLFLYGALRLFAFWLGKVGVTPNLDPKHLFLDRSSTVTMLLAMATICIILINMIFVVSAAVAVTLSGLLIVHRLLWPFIDRLVYTLQGAGLLPRKKILVPAGIFLIGASVGRISWLAKIWNTIRYIFSG